MPTKASTKTPTKRKTAKKIPLSGEIPLGYVFPSEKAARAARRKALKDRAFMDEVYALADLTTLKHQKREHQANFELFDARQQLASISKSPWRYNEVGKALFLKKLVEQGELSEFPGLKQSDAAAILHGLAEWQQQQLAAQEQQSN